VLARPGSPHRGCRLGAHLTDPDLAGHGATVSPDGPIVYIGVRTTTWAGFTHTINMSS